MEFKKYLSFFSKKKKQTKSSIPLTIYNNYSCEEKTLEITIKDYLNGIIPTKECLAIFISIMAYHECYHLPENAEIFSLLEDFLINATWKKERTADCGDYDPLRPDYWLKCIHSTYSILLMDIETSNSLLSQNNKALTYDNFLNVSFEKNITEEFYLNKEKYEAKRDELKSIVDKGDFSPLEALLLIKDNWDILYPYQSTYESIEYCIAASENHTEYKYFNQAFRNYGYKMGNIYKRATEN